MESRPAAPYSQGDVVEVRLGERPTTAIVSAVLVTSACDPRRRWRVLCRDTGSGMGIGTPLYCGDDGVGDRLAPLAADAREPVRP